jgi:AbrB family looped-hinge helix DNA binding protein
MNLPIGNYSWHNHCVKSEIDRFGRILIPKALRDRMGLSAGSQVELTEDHGKVIVEPVQESHLLSREEDGLLVLHAAPISTIDPIVRLREDRSRRVIGEAGS